MKKLFNTKKLWIASVTLILGVLVCGFCFGESITASNPHIQIKPVANDMNISLHANTGFSGMLNARNTSGYNVTCKPEHGNLTVNKNGTFTYTPNTNFMGIDTFKYQANNGKINSSIATVTINLVNQVPDAEFSNFTINKNQKYQGILVAQDADNDGLNYKIVSKPEHGNLTVNKNGTYCYCPDENFSGTDSFTYLVNDGLNDSNIATVNIGVNNLVIYVANNGSDNNDGLSPGTAKQHIMAALTASNSGDIIQIAAGTYKENLEINKAIILIGNDPLNTIIDGQQSCCVHILPNNNVVITALTIKNGGRCQYGGGIYNEGTLTLENSIITENHADNGGGIYNKGSATLKTSILSSNSADSGAGIYNDGPLDLENSTFIKNHADISCGGAIRTKDNNTINTLNVKIIENHAKYGGGIYVEGSLTLDGLNLQGNSADSGGAIYNNGKLDLKNSNLTYNDAWYERGGAIYSQNDLTIENSNLLRNCASYGGALYNHEATATITNTNITENHAGTYDCSDHGDGGGISNDGGILTLKNSDVSYNVADSSCGGGIDNQSHQFFHCDCELYVIDSFITHNRAYKAGGGIYNEGNYHISNSDISGNTAYDANNIFT